LENARNASNITSRNVTYSAHCTSTIAHGKYTQASTWLLEVACWKYLEKYFGREYL